MTKVFVTEVYRITANPMVIGDIDKLVVEFVKDGIQRKTVVLWQDFKNKTEFSEILKDAVTKAKEPKRSINLTNTLMGEYNI